MRFGNFYVAWFKWMKEIVKQGGRDSADIKMYRMKNIYLATWLVCE